MEILEFNFVVLNYQLVTNLNASITVVKENFSFKLKVDTSDFSAIDDLTDLNCFFEMKYTNKHGIDENLCYILKKQLNIKFSQLISTKIVNLFDLDEHKFQIELLVKNLTDNHIYLEYPDKKDEILNGKSEVTLRQNILKFGLSLTNEISYLINERLNIKYAFNRTSYFDLKIERQNLNKNFKCILFKNPLDIIFDLKSNIQSNDSVYTLGIFVRNNILLDNLDTSISFEILDKLRIINGEKNLVIHTARSADSFIVKEINFISNFSPNEIRCRIRLDDIKWEFKLNFTTKQLTYLLN